jgi:hypothetical protein
MLSAHTTWVRRNGLLWSDISPNNAAERNWAAVTGLEQELSRASNRGLQVILIIRGTPTWAQQVSGAACGPIKPEALADFASFMVDVVTRYSASPYHVRYFELWNEPDVDPALVAPDSPYGCWGDQDDPYYGGGYFAEMLKAVYPAIKAINPQAQVLVGGLLLDCDPRNHPVSKDCTPSRFLEGILRNGGGPYFDGVSFHAYDYYAGSLGEFYNPSWGSAWNNSGPVASAKLDYLLSLLDDPTYGAPGKFLMNTEAALLCDACASDNDFETTKAYYVARLYATALAEGLQANVWFTPLGWRNSGLLNLDLTPRPAYTAYKFARLKLGGADYVAPKLGFNLDGDPEIDVAGYEFTHYTTRLWVLWSLDGNTHIVPLTNTPSGIYDTLGNSEPLTGNTVTITREPFYIEWAP